MRDCASQLWSAPLCSSSCDYTLDDLIHSSWSSIFSFAWNFFSSDGIDTQPRVLCRHDTPPFSVMVVLSFFFSLLLTLCSFLLFSSALEKAWRRGVLLWFLSLSVCFGLVSDESLCVFLSFSPSRRCRSSWEQITAWHIVKTMKHVRRKLVVETKTFPLKLSLGRGMGRNLFDEGTLIPLQLSLQIVLRYFRD